MNSPLVSKTFANVCVCATISLEELRAGYECRSTRGAARRVEKVHLTLTNLRYDVVYLPRVLSRSYSVYFLFCKREANRQMSFVKCLE